MYSKAMFAKQFKELIDKRGLTQRAVAERINTTETTISRYVSGDRTPNIETPAGFVVAARPLYDPRAAGHHNVHAT